MLSIGTIPINLALTTGQGSWAIFDWATQPFFTLVTTFFFGPYFANELVAAAELARLKANLLRTLAVSLSSPRPIRVCLLVMPQSFVSSPGSSSRCLLSRV